MPDAISFRSIRKQFGSLRALDGVEFTIQEGEFFALLGPNGAGKTTLISILGGLTKPDSGKAEVMGFDVQTHYREARRNVGIVPQELVFDPFFTVRETLKFQSGYFGLRNNQNWIDEILENLGLEDKADTNMRALSGGMKRRVMVAQALVHRPPVIVLDEPTAGVDVELRQTLWDFIKRLNEKGHTIVLTTHYLEEAEVLCNRIAMLRQGKVIALDTKDNLLSEHQSVRSLNIRLSGGNLPRGLHNKLICKQHDQYQIRLSSPEELEWVLAEIRVAGLQILDMGLDKPDLEQVFVATMRRHDAHA